MTSLVNKQTGVISNAASGTVTYTGATANNALIVKVSYINTSGDFSAPTVKKGGVSLAIDNAPTPFTVSAGDVGAGCWSLLNIASGSHAIVIAFGVTGFAEITIEEHNGIASSSAVDKTASNGTATGGSGVTTGNTGTTAATTQANEMVAVVLAIACGTGKTNAGISTPASSGYSSTSVVQNTSANVGAEHSYQDVTSTGTQTASWTWTSDATFQGYQGVITTYKYTPPAAGSSQLSRNASDGGMQAMSGGMRCAGRSRRSRYVSVPANYFGSPRRDAAQLGA